jgi:hypothetical protein
MKAKIESPQGLRIYQSLSKKAKCFDPARKKYSKIFSYLSYLPLLTRLFLIVLASATLSCWQLVTPASPENQIKNADSGSQTFGVDAEKPAIIASVEPKQNEYGWNNSNVTVRFICNDAVVLKCPEPVSLEKETSGQTVTGTAVDKAGNKIAASVVVRIDKTEPLIEQLWPPSQKFITNRSSVNIEGRLTDSISGIHQAFIYDQTGKVPIKGTDFDMEKKLQALISDRAISENKYIIEVIDFAGNSGKKTILVRHVNGNVVTPTDPSKTEKINGIITSINRALIRFEPSVTSDAVYAISREEGGRFAGYLPGSNIALVDFRTKRVEDLKQILNSMKKKRKGVLEALPVVFWEPQQFDNSALSGADAIAYLRVNLPQAETYIQNTFLNTCTTCHINKHANVAIIDSGLDTSYGLNNEFDKIKFYDLCTEQGQQGDQGAPKDDTGHGTQLTGIITGANNGSGNNGIVTGLTNADLIGVNVFRTQCSAGAGGFDGALITAAMELIVTNKIPDINVVNMSFGLGSADTQVKEWLASFYKPYFLSEEGQKIIWVASAGNNDSATACDNFLVYPAGLACDLFNVISVGGFNPGNYMRSPLSNYGPAISIYAPGSSAYTAKSTGTYGYSGGTSAATAFVVGAASLSQAFTPSRPSLFKYVLGGTAQNLLDASLSQGGLDINQLLRTPLIQDYPKKNTYKGSSSGGEKPVLFSEGTQLPGLAGFGFSFDNGDHHIDTIIAGSFPYNSQQNTNLKSVSMVDYSDWSRDDDYHYRLDLQDLPFATTYHTISDCNESGLSFTSLLGDIGPVTVPVLTGFKFDWDAVRDNHLKKIKVQLFTSGNYLYTEIAYEDKEPVDEGFCYSISYALVPSDRVRGKGELSGEAIGSQQVASTTIKPVLQGFELDFDSTDHHLDELGVLLEPFKATVLYSDIDHGDNFHWRIWWADIR